VNLPEAKSGRWGAGLTAPKMDGYRRKVVGFAAGATLKSCYSSATGSSRMG